MRKRRSRRLFLAQSALLLAGRSVTRPFLVRGAANLHGVPSENGAALLGNVAYRAGHKLGWDWPNLKAVGCREADLFLHHRYRKGRSLSCDAPQNIESVIA